MLLSRIFPVSSKLLTALRDVNTASSMYVSRIPVWPWLTILFCVAATFSEDGSGPKIRMNKDLYCSGEVACRKNGE